MNEQTDSTGDKIRGLLLIPAMFTVAGAGLVIVMWVLAVIGSCSEWLQGGTSGGVAKHGREVLTFLAWIAALGWPVVFSTPARVEIGDFWNLKWSVPLTLASVAVIWAFFSCPNH